MSTLITQITPLSHGKPSVKAQCQYVLVQFGKGDQYATTRINFLDEDKNVNAAYDVAFTAEELESWGTDDSFVISAALAKLGIALKA